MIILVIASKGVAKLANIACQALQIRRYLFSIANDSETNNSGCQATVASFAKAQQLH